MASSSAIVQTRSRNGIETPHASGRVLTDKLRALTLDDMGTLKDRVDQVAELSLLECVHP